MKRTLTLTSSMAALALGAGAALPAAAQTAQTAQEFCSTATPKPINDEQTTTDAIVVPPDIGTIADLDVSVDISHRAVGDLMITLDHAPPGTTTILIDPTCPRADIDATFDDEATDAAQAMCNDPPPAIGWDVTGIDLLSSYDGQDIAGTWT